MFIYRSNFQKQANESTNNVENKLRRKGPIWQHKTSAFYKKGLGKRERERNFLPSAGSVAPRTKGRAARAKITAKNEEPTTDSAEKRQKCLLCIAIFSTVYPLLQFAPTNAGRQGPPRCGDQSRGEWPLKKKRRQEERVRCEGDGLWSRQEGDSKLSRAMEREGGGAASDVSVGEKRR